MSVREQELPRSPLSLALIGLGAGTVREQVGLAHELGYRWVQLNAAAIGARPRELGRSARRDLAALLRRHELRLSGVDLFIPEPHYREAANADRAIGAACEGVRFAAELAALSEGRPVLSVSLPSWEEGRAAVETIARCADESGAIVADHRWPRDDSSGRGSMGVGVDPAMVLLAGGDPAGAVSAAGGALVSARLSDLGSAGRARPGTGRLNLMLYLASVAVSGRAGPLVVDLRQVPGPGRAAAETLALCGERAVRS